MKHLRRSSLPRLATMLVALAGASVGTAQAIEFRSLSEPAIMYDAPSEQGKRLFILRPGTPVEVVVTLDKWIKVREPGGSLNWVERRVLANRRTVLVTAERAAVRREARDDALLSFEAARNVVLELAEPPSLGWVKVRHADGLIGYIRAGDIWGL
jgi:SH3-like domain-containing protein